MSKSYLPRFLLTVILIVVISGCKNVPQTATNGEIKGIASTSTPDTNPEITDTPQNSSPEKAALPSKTDTLPPTLNQRLVVTSYPWNWPKEGAPDFGFVGNLQPAADNTVFSDYLKRFSPKWGKDWDTEKKREYLFSVKFIGQIKVWWQEVLCNSKETPEIYEFSFNTSYYGNEMGAKQFVSDIKKSDPDFKETSFQNRAVAKSNSTASWSCDSKKVNLDINEVTVVLHKWNVSTFIYLASPKMSTEDIEKKVMKFADDYESWIDKSAVPLTRKTQFEVPTELVGHLAIR